MQFWPLDWSRTVNSIRRTAKALAALSLAALLTYCADSTPITGVSSAPSAPTLRVAQAPSASTDGSLSLIACPNKKAKTMTRTVGPMGGRLHVEGSSLDIPAGAVPEATE